MQEHGSGGRLSWRALSPCDQFKDHILATPGTQGVHCHNNRTLDSMDGYVGEEARIYRTVSCKLSLEEIKPTSLKLVLTWLTS